MEEGRAVSVETFSYLRGDVGKQECLVHRFLAKAWRQVGPRSARRRGFRQSALELVRCRRRTWEILASAAGTR